LEEDLRARGGVDAPPSAADLVIVNSCSVTAAADQGTRQTVRRIARDNPSARIVVTGCYATRRPDEVAALPGVVRVVRNADKDRLREMGTLNFAVSDAPDQGCSDSGATLTVKLSVPIFDGPCGAAIEPGVAGRTAFTLRVQTGCEERCSYCIIPATRGAGRSLPVGEVVRQVERIAAAGFKEIALTGVHLGSYGRDLQPRATLFELLASLERSPADVVFRISSLEPMDCAPEIVDLVARSGGRFAPHFHLPLQHASDRLLALMCRPYSLDHYRRLVDRIVDRLPHASIGSDVIAGFPGEAASDFQANLDYLPRSPLSHLHVFPYSDRPGTAAAALAGKVAGPVIRDRAAQLRAVGAALSRRFRESQVGTTRPGLTLEDGTLVVTDNYLKVRIAPGVRRNERIMVRIDSDGAGAITSASTTPAVVPEHASATTR
jgi:threonylcarbamoyladenosine tRNA methylthiotransferase MtaB